jgi:GT2 family glycosyltransferase
MTGECHRGQPPLSIVIPTHDTRELTLRCLDSIAAAAPACELIVVDDASEDGTAAAIEGRLPGVTVMVNARRAGFARSANRGLAAAAGELLLLLNSDTEVAAASLPALQSAFAADPQLGIAGAELRFPDGAPQWSAGLEPSPRWLFAQASGLPALIGRLPGYRRLRPVGRGPGTRVDWVSGAAMAMRRAVWEAAGPLDEGYRFYCQDLDLCLAARELGWRVAVVPGFVVIHHHGATISAGGGSAAPYHPELMWTDLVRFADKRGGPAAARRAASALKAGARLRLIGRALAAPCIGRGRRQRWRQDTAAFAAGLRALQRP